MPIAIGYLSIVAATDHRRSAAILLRTIDPVGKLIVHRHVIKLRSWLVVPGTPRLAAVQSNDSALIDS